MINHGHHISISRPYHQFLITTPPPERCLLAPASARPHQVSKTGTLRKKNPNKTQKNQENLTKLRLHDDHDGVQAGILMILFYWTATTSRLPMTHHWHIVAPQRSPASVLHQPPSLRASPIRMLTWRHRAHGAHGDLDPGGLKTQRLIL